jgi:hypothetical protein
MDAYTKFATYARPSVRARFDPYLNRLLQSVCAEEWEDALLDITGIARLIQKHQQLETNRGAAGAPHNTEHHDNTH